MAATLSDSNVTLGLAMSRVAIVTVNYRTGGLVVRSLAAIALERSGLAHDVAVYVVDNNSGDGSVEMISDAIDANGWADWVRLRPQTWNGGFAAGNNAALRELLAGANPPDYVFFLNPDSEVQPGALGLLLDYLDQHPEVAILGTRLEDPDGTIRSSAFRYPSPATEFLRGAEIGLLEKIIKTGAIAQHALDVPHRADWVSGASFVARRQVFERAGLFDEGYFLYYEEIDLMRQVARAGLEVWHHPLARVVHLAGQATKIKGGRAQGGKLPRYWYDSWRRYFVKQHGRAGAALAASCWLAGRGLNTIKRLIRPKRDTAGQGTAVDFVQYALLPALLHGARDLRFAEATPGMAAAAAPAAKPHDQ